MSGPSRSPAGPALLTLLLGQAAGCDQLKGRAEAPPFLVFVEREVDAKTKQPVMRAYPLAARLRDKWIDVSCDPGLEPTDWEKLTVERFPLGARPSLRAFASGQPLGILRLDAIGPEQVSCNELVLGRVSLLPNRWGKPLLNAPPRFLGLHGLPRQLDWRSDFPFAGRAAVVARLAGMGRKKLNLPPGQKVDQSAWSWFNGGPGKAPHAAGRVVFRLPGEEEGEAILAVWNAVVALDDQGQARVVWESFGTGAETEGPVEFELLDAVDVDGDGVPELLLRSTAYESMGFVLLRIGPGAPAFIWEGSAYGC